MPLQAIGELLILAALAMNVVSGLSFWRVGRGTKAAEKLAIRSYHVFAALAVLASALLYYLFFSHNYAFKYVYEYSQKSQPFFYILAAFWGGQEGTYLLWLLLMALFGYVIIRRGGQYTGPAMTVYCLINLFFLLIMTKLSPFAYLPFYAPDGAGLNPLLRDPWMVVHPPIMFVGYALAAIPFSIAMSALIRNDYSGWLRLAFPWAALTAVMLGAGNILGGFWAYKTLGWGGYWGWDPVENSSFVPWMISLALLHGLIIERRTGALRRVNLLLSAFLFLLVIYGTFLTRSGVLADFSVHSFVDLGVNVYLVGFMAVFFVLALAAFLWRAAKIPSQSLNYNPYGREFSLFAALSLLFVTGAVVLFWSSLPVLTSMFGMEPRAAEVSTYNNFALPFAVLFSLVLLYSPFSTYLSEPAPPRTTSIAIGFGIAALLGFGLFYAFLGAGLTFGILFTIVLGTVLMFLNGPAGIAKIIPALIALLVAALLMAVAGVSDYLYILFLTTAAMGFASNLVVLAPQVVRNWLLTGGHVAHAGFTLMLVGILASSAFSTREKVIIPQNDSRTAFDMMITYRGMESDIMEPHNRLILNVTDGDSHMTLNPELYFSRRMDGLFKKPAIVRHLTEDIYMAPEQIIEATRGGGLELTRDVPKEVSGYTFTFLGFSVSDHSADVSKGLRATTLIQVSHDSALDTIAPAVIQRIDQTGHNHLVDEPGILRTTGGDTILVTIAGLQVDRGEITLDVPGLVESRTPERLVLDVSRKPLMNLVWAGVILILIGCSIVFFRRFSEMSGSNKGTSRI